jgi:hypothetical protein
MDNKIFSPSIIRSPLSDFYGKEIEDSIKNHPDWYLEEIKKEGFDSVWLHGVLREIVSCSCFPEFGDEKKIYALNKFVEKTAKHGIKVFLYLCEPRGFKEKDKFWEKHSDVKGQPMEFTGIGDLSDKYYALCSSTQKVKDYLYESSYNLFKKVQGLGGVFLITASEFHTHCYSHYPKWKKEVKNFPEMLEWAKQGFYCKRCAEREPYHVVSEIINLINKGVKDADKEVKVITWAWSWNIIEPDPQKKLINELSPDVILMVDWERGGYKFFGGKKYPIDEYSASYIGPSPRFRKIFQTAKKSNLSVMAKIQMATTHELVTIPYLPVIFNFAEKIDRMRKMGINGFLYCWVFGGDISPISKIVGKFNLSEKKKNKIIEETSMAEFGKKTYKYVIKAWKKFSEGFLNYPFEISFIYNGPINYATVYPLDIEAKKIDVIPSWRSLPREKKGHLAIGDNLETWISMSYPVVISQFKKVLYKWQKGINALEEGLKTDKENKRLIKEIDISTHIYLSIKSTINIIDFYLNLRKYRKGDKKSLKILKKIMADELTITKADYTIFKRNRDFGYHPEAHENFLSEDDFKYKIKLLHQDIKKIEKEVKKRWE